MSEKKSKEDKLADIVNLIVLGFTTGLLVALFFVMYANTTPQEQDKYCGYCTYNIESLEESGMDYICSKNKITWKATCKEYREWFEEPPQPEQDNNIIYTNESSNPNCIEWSKEVCPEGEEVYADKEDELLCYNPETWEQGGFGSVVKKTCIKEQDVIE